MSSKEDTGKLLPNTRRREQCSAFNKKKRYYRPYIIFRWLDYRMQRVKQKADQSKEQRENIELPEEKVSVRGEPIPFKANTEN